MRRFFPLVLVIAAVASPASAAPKPDDIHVTGTVSADSGLSTTLGGVDTNYVNLNNPNSGIRWQSAQILVGTGDPSQPYPPLPCGPCGPAYAPASSLFLRQTPTSTGELWFKVGPNPTDWRNLTP